MPLISRFFRDDKQLASCLVNDAAHVIPGARGEHVGKIQVALAVLDGANIDSADLDTKTYGAATAAAVLSYKTKRRIINHSYQQQADNIVGKMTIARLDREMHQWELASVDQNYCSSVARTTPIRHPL
jgi:hypothetical protein